MSDQYIIESAALDPMLASFWGIPGHDEEITDYSPEGWAARLELQQRTLRALSEVEPHDRGERIATEVMRERVQAELDLIESGEYHRWLCILNGHHEYVREIFDFMPRQSDEEWQNVQRQADGRSARPSTGCAPAFCTPPRRVRWRHDDRPWPARHNARCGAVATDISVSWPQNARPSI